MSALTKQVEELNENSVKIQDTVHSVMTTALSQQTAAQLPHPKQTCQ